ncbi:MAG: hypothetical protein WKF34_02515 [Pyrinomonadaceae bacterium]
MILNRSLVFAALLLIPGVVAAQQSSPLVRVGGPIRGSAAFAEVMVRRVELTADLESFAADYTDQNPKVLDARAELLAIERALTAIYAVKPTETERLTLALGKLLVRRAAFETDLARLSRSYAKDHPEVKRAKRRVEIFDAAIREIL